MGELLPYGKEPKPFKGFALKQVPKKGEKKPKLFKENVESTKGELPHGQKLKLFMENVESTKGKLPHGLKIKLTKENVERPRPKLHRLLHLVKQISVVKHTI